MHRWLVPRFESAFSRFQLFIKALAEFACNLRFPDTSMDAIRLIRTCARVVSERGPQFSSSGSSTSVVALTPLTATTDVNPASDLADSANIEAPPISDAKPPLSPTKTVTAEGIDDLLWRRGWMPVLYELFRVINKYA